ncbi:homocysteine S-methyltransferase [Exilibacterium tricleocarpae]|uniref:Homocysteine S-methyltransferase n=1 Tax=Exilibacterium tricleocarpae TaxID=2591008 RepID=A0A545SP10_9GAMM|nr:homocysteine S-methyltransferase family protein [Exilibacterium tricleocarpae]TQV66722.1 homocysteine S-methyltransferase [Exilibacterium tricleocarpae]
MVKYRKRLPQLQGAPFITDSGLETTLIFEEGLDLPHFAAFHLLQDKAGTETLRQYFIRHAGIARHRRVGFILESVTWRANPDWGHKLGYGEQALATANRRAIALLTEIRREMETPQSPMVISGCIGPRGDGYDPGTAMTAAQAETYHATQIKLLADTAADQVTAITMTNTPEAIGITRAARAAKIPAVISFTVETDGRLPTGQPLGEAIEAVDAATDKGPAYYMTNCAHPTHFRDTLADHRWMRRLRGIRANASTRSHAELDAATDLDAGDPLELGREYAAIRRRFPWVNVLGGCCGTDHRHIEQICTACLEVTS